MSGNFAVADVKSCVLLDYAGSIRYLESEPSPPMPRITIYTTPTCPFCWAAVRLLKGKQLDFDEINVAFDPAGRARMRERAGGANTVPQIWIGLRHIGGCDDLHALEASGELDRILEQGAAT